MSRLLIDRVDLWFHFLYAFDFSADQVFQLYQFSAHTGVGHASARQSQMRKGSFPKCVRAREWQIGALDSVIRHSSNHKLRRLAGRRLNPDKMAHPLRSNLESFVNCWKGCNVMHTMCLHSDKSKTSKQVRLAIVSSDALVMQVLCSDSFARWGHTVNWRTQSSRVCVQPKFNCWSKLSLGSRCWIPTALNIWLWNRLRVRSSLGIRSKLTSESLEWHILNLCKCTRSFKFANPTAVISGQPNKLRWVIGCRWHILRRSLSVNP